MLEPIQGRVEPDESVVRCAAHVSVGSQLAKPPRLPPDRHDSYLGDELPWSAGGTIAKMTPSGHVGESWRRMRLSTTVLT